MPPSSPAISSLEIFKERLYDKCRFKLTDLRQHTASVEYEACSLDLDGKKVEWRVSKITPTKTGQFVTIWKRSSEGITEPFAISDELDFIVITSKSGDNIGQFVFSTSVLVEKGIITANGTTGKRGIRVYPPWDVPTSKQAERTQAWQIKYFLWLRNEGFQDLALAKRLFASRVEFAR